MEITDFLQAFLKLTERPRRLAMATVLRCEGSTPVRPGARAIIGARRVLAGTVGGGIAEAEAQRQAALAIRTGRGMVFDVDLTGTREGEENALCGGRMRILVDPGAACWRETYAQAAADLQHRRAGVWLTAQRPGDPVEIRSQWVPRPDMDSHSGFPAAADLAQCLNEKTTKMFCRPPAPDAPVEEQVFVEPWFPKPQLVIVGAGHVGRELAVQAGRVGFEIVVLDDRPEFVRPKFFPPGTMALSGELPGIVESFPCDADTFVVIVTRSAEQDAQALVSVLNRPTAYVGLIGSRRKVDRLRRTLVQSGAITEDDFRRVHAPIGLNIGAVTVPEIAASIVAQLIAVRRRGGSPEAPTQT